MREGAVDSQRGKENCIELFKDPEYGKEKSNSRFNCRARKVKFGENLLKT